MPWQIQHATDKQMLVVNTTGTLCASAIAEMTREIFDAIAQTQSRKVLVDYSEAVRQLSPSDVYERPAQVAQFQGHRDVWTAVVFRELDEEAQFLEHVYVNRGFHVRVFDDRSAAMIWLDTGTSPQDFRRT